MNELWPPYCGAEKHKDGELVAICERQCHDPVIAKHVDIARGIGWFGPWPLVRDPFEPSSGS